MKRSEINSILKQSDDFYKSMGFYLPSWAHRSPSEWVENRALTEEIRTCQLGWDITDFGSDRFSERGLVLFTLRNGLQGSKWDKSYAEKIMIVCEDQETPFHFHWNKQEDIINRGGGRLVFELYESSDDEEFRNEDVVLSKDGVQITWPAGKPLALEPGESLCLTQGLYHRFYAEKGSGSVLCGEVSMVNDDAADNRFYEPLCRFSGIEEDEAPLWFLVGDYNDKEAVL